MPYDPVKSKLKEQNDIFLFGSRVYVEGEPVMACMGDWTDIFTYTRGDVVFYGGIAYLSKVVSNLNHLPTDPDYWTALGAAGDYVEIKSVQPVWMTNPDTTTFGGYLYIE